tara:strand:+ start:889 stop:1167 length:279 start_codon:yes stop_codon:yes gene_type:complete
MTCKPSQLLGYIYADTTTFCKNTQSDNVIFELDKTYAGNSYFLLSGSGLYYNGSTLPDSSYIYAKVDAFDYFGRQPAVTKVIRVQLKSCVCD